MKNEKKKTLTGIILLTMLNAFVNVSDIVSKPKISLMIASFPSNKVGQLVNISTPFEFNRFNCA